MPDNPPIPDDAESEAERFAQKNTEWHDRIQERIEAMRQESVPERQWVKVRDLSDHKDRFSADAQIEVCPLTALTQERERAEEAERRTAELAKGLRWIQATADGGRGSSTPLKTEISRKARSLLDSTPS